MKNYQKLFYLFLFISLFYYTNNINAQTWQTYDSLRTNYQQKQSYDTALFYAEEALRTVKEKRGENDTLYADMLTVIVEINYYKGNYAKAIEYGEKEKVIRKTIQGEKHIGYATSLNNLAALYNEAGNYSESEILYLEAKNIYKELLGEKHLSYAMVISNLGELYFNIGNYCSAEQLLKEAKNIRKEVLGEKNQDYATSLNNLALLYKTTGNYTVAEKLYLEAKNIYKEVLGEKHPDYITSLSNLAQLYRLMSNYSAAEQYLLQVINVRKEVLGPKHTSYASSLSNLAILYQVMGNYPAAETLLVESLNITKEVLGVKHPYYAGLLNNLAGLYQAIGKYKLAESLFLEAKSIIKESLGEKHANYALELNNLAGLYKAMDKNTLAEPMFIEALNIRKEAFGEKHPSYAISLSNLAELYYEEDNYSASEPLFLEALKIDKEVFGENNPVCSIDFNNLAKYYNRVNNNSIAEPYYYEGLRIINNSITQNFTFLSEREKEMYFKTKSETFEGFYSFALKRKDENNDITKTVFNNVVRNKGLLLKSSTAMRTAILNSRDTSLISQYEKWIDLKKEISKLYSTEISKRKKNPEELEQSANVLEKELVKGSQLFSDFEKLQNLNWETVKKSLKPGEAAIEFIHFAEGKKNDTIIYCALLITPESKQPEMLKLFEEKQMLKILNSISGSNFNQVNGIYGTNKKMNDSLYRLIWQPMEKYLEGVKTVYYSPDGLLHKISFAALGKGKNMYLCDNYNLQQISSTGKVAMPENTLIDKNLTACIIGGIDYSADSSDNSLWQYLPGTFDETNAISTKLSKKKISVTTYTSKKANELTLKNIYSGGGNRPEILHIATHGFFYPDPEQTEKDEKENVKVEEGFVAFRGGNSGFGLWQFVKNKNPLMRSGLVFAGANNVWNQRFVGEGEDGVLTAQEVTQLDMSKTKLVVLSACETGLGDIKGSEGVYGLQRAFKMAGVKFIIMSLWQVPDKETEEFMITFYTKLLKIKDIRKSFNETQKEMRQKYDPYYWAAFVLVE